MAATNTADRLSGLEELGVLGAESAGEPRRAWDTLMGLRLRAGAGPAAPPPRPGRPRRREAAALREAIGELPLLHKRISFDFLGAAL